MRLQVDQFRIPILHADWLEGIAEFSDAASKPLEEGSAYGDGMNTTRPAQPSHRLEDLHDEAVREHPKAVWLDPACRLILNCGTACHAHLENKHQYSYHDDQADQKDNAHGAGQELKHGDSLSIAVYEYRPASNVVARQGSRSLFLSLPFETVSLWKHPETTLSMTP